MIAVDSDNVVFADGDLAFGDDGFLRIGKKKDVVHTADNCTLVDVQSPDDFVPRAYSYNGSFSVINQALLDSGNAKKVSAARDKLIADVKTARTKAIYNSTPVTVPFPVTEHPIQFRTERDEHNLSAKVQAAQALMNLGNATAEITFRTADDVNVTMEAQELATAGLAVLAIKDSIFYQYTTIIDDAKDANTLAALDLVRADLEALIAGN